jgi:hypothetical protein
MTCAAASLTPLCCDPSAMTLPTLTRPRTSGFNAIQSLASTIACPQILVNFPTPSNQIRCNDEASQVHVEQTDPPCTAFYFKIAIIKGKKGK